MFQLSLVSDLTKIPPNLFNIPRHSAIRQELNDKYANKVIPKLGLVIAVWDILDVEDGLLKPGDGAIFMKVKFRCIVFKPFVGEVLTGWVESCTPDGIKVNMEFFDDIFIPKSLIFENAYYKDNAWVWPMDEEDNLYIDVNEKINFRIEEEVFNEPKKPPYALVASCQTDGMGCLSWWG